MNYRKWTIVLLINLLIVASLGLLMRYKIAFSFPLLEQKHIQHAHSHFAFIAWISQALYLALIHLIEKHKSINTKKYNLILLINTTLSYGMLISFLLKGYHISSNSFSFLLILNSIIFTYNFIKDVNTSNVNSSIKPWFYFSLFFNFISIAGTFALVYMMVNKIYHQHYQLASVYYYLHFQYNGWFLATCLGLFFYQLSLRVDLKRIKLYAYLFCIAIIPNYFLSVLWLPIPVWLYSLVVFSALLQLLIWIDVIWQLQIHKSSLLSGISSNKKIIVYILIFAFSLKLILQLFSTIPYISHLAYSLRPIVIAYLHLVLLVVISLFLISYYYAFIRRVASWKEVLLFAISILANELLLGLQGLAGMFSIAIPNIQYYLFAVSIIIVISLANMFKKNIYL